MNSYSSRALGYRCRKAYGRVIVLCNKWQEISIPCFLSAVFSKMLPAFLFMEVFATSSFPCGCFAFCADCKEICVVVPCGDSLLWLIWRLDVAKGAHSPCLNCFPTSRSPENLYRNRHMYLSLLAVIVHNCTSTMIVCKNNYAYQLPLPLYAFPA